MAGPQRQRIRSLYGEIAGILPALPSSKEVWAIETQIGNQYNAAVDELSAAADTDYARYKLLDSDMNEDRDGYVVSVARTRIASLTKRLEEEYSFGQSSSSQGAPVIITVQQNQTLNVHVIPI